MVRNMVFLVTHGCTAMNNIRQVVASLFIGMAADVLNELICHKIPVDDFISWLKAENLESCSTTWKCGRKDFVPYFLNFLRTQTSRLLKLGSRSTPSKVQQTLQERKNSRRSRLELFPLNQHSDGDISGGIRSLDVSSVDLQDVKEQGSPSDDICGKKRSDTMKKRIMMSPGGDCGSPLAQSSPLQTSESSYRRSSRDPDSLQRSFNLEEFIVKSNRSSRKKSESQSSSKSRKRINPTRLGSGKSKESGTCFGLASQSCEPSASFCEQPLEMSRSHNFEEERTLLRKVRQRCDGPVAVSPAKMVATSCVEFLEADPAFVSHTAQLDVLADVYSCLLNTNLVLNVMTELCFVMGLLVVRIPVECNENADTNECMFFSSVHNCVYFAVKVLNQQRQLLESLDKVTLKMLADNRYILAFRPELYKFINELLIADACRRISVSLRSATVQANVSYQSDTDNRQNFPNDQAFHMFRKQRDGLYEILRMWEANHLSPGWSFAVVLGPRIRTLLNLHNEPANFIHFARLFRSQLLGTCSGYSRCTEFTLGNDSGGNSLDILKEVNPDKLSRLRERLVTPIPSGGPCPLPTFPGQQEFYRNFILHSSHPMFLQHLTDSLISEILELNDTDFTASDLEDTDTSVDDATRSSYLACVSALRLLAKFLGFIVFLPYQSKIKPLPESMVTAHSTVRAKLCPQFDVLACVNEAVRMHKLVLTLPWIVKYLSMMDSVSVHLPYYRAVFEQLFCIYQSAKGPGRPSLLVRLLLGWLFESPNFPESLFYSWKQTNNLVETGGELGHVVPLDSLDVVDEHCLYLCCPFLGELKLCLSVGIGSSSRSVKHITPISASLNQPSAARQIELLLEESFFHGQPASTRKTVEYIAERVASCCVKHICNTLLPRVKQQGSANVEKLLSARISTDTSLSETAVKQVKESLLKEVTVIADKCSDDFRQCFYNDVTEYCQQRCKRAMPTLLADDVLETVCHSCAQIAARLSQERVNMWIQSHITAGLFLKEFQLDIEKAFRNASKGDNKNDNICKASHVVPPGGRNVKHIDAVVTPAQAIMQVRELICQLLDGHKNNVSEQQVLALLKMVHSTLSNRADLIPSAEKMLPTLLVDLALLLVVHQPAMMTSTLMDGFMHVLRLSEECESVMRLLCPRNLLLMSQSAHTADVVWSCFAKLLAHLLKSNMLTPDGLEQQCVALLRVTWPQDILNRISSCIREVIQLSGSVGDEKFMLLMQWLMETCDEMTLFNDM